MSKFDIPARRFILAGGFALAVAAAPAVGAFAVTPALPGTALAACAGGEDEDMYTSNCVPNLVPNSPFSTPAGNPDLPEIDGIPCTGRDSGACIGLAEDAPQYVPPTSSVGSDPTITGSTN